MKFPARLLTYRATLAAFAMAPLLLTSSCATRFPEEKVPRMKILVMDFELPPGMRETPTAIRGWWLGAKTIHQNPRAGTIFAERLTANMARLPYVNLWSRVDLKYYFARKRQRLVEIYDYLEDEEIDELMRQAPAIDFARELGADKMITGRVLENYLSENRTIHYWSSRAHIECQIVDVLTGEVEWTKEYQLKKGLSSQIAVQEEIARQVIEDLKQEYFLPMTVAGLQ